MAANEAELRRLMTASLGGDATSHRTLLDLLSGHLRAYYKGRLKIVFTLCIVVPTSIYLTRLARPGGERKTSIAWLVIPFSGIMLLAAISLAFAPSSHWSQMIVGDQWLECLLSIPLIGIVPFAVIIAAVRRMAPTDLVRTGAFCGLAAGALSATGYAFHCTDDSLPFVALWYGGTIALCTVAGAKLGPRLLRW